MLLYTGQRRSEIASLVVGDLHLDAAQPYVLIREDTTKDKDKRAVPLHPMLTDELRRFVPKNVARSEPAFPNFPSYDALFAAFRKAGVERRDTTGRVVHFHSFRKIWQTWGVNAGISQRVAQEVLGHSDPALTANVYTDVPAIGMHDEIAKLPWVGPLGSALETQKAGAAERFRRMPGDLVNLAKVVVPVAPAVGEPALAGTGEWLPGLGSFTSNAK